MASKKQSSFYDDYKAKETAQNQLNQSILNGTTPIQQNVAKMNASASKTSSTPKASVMNTQPANHWYCLQNGRTLEEILL